MNYIIVDTAKATKHGFRTIGHRTKGGTVLLNERELMNCPTLQGSLDERAAAVEGKVLTETSAMAEINGGGWKYE